MPFTPDGYYYIDDLDAPADMGAHSLADAEAAQAVMDAHEAAADARYVGLTGAQTIAGVKTFSSSPVLPGNASTALQAVPKQQLDALIAALVPAGTIAMWASAAAPSGWRLCDGSALRRADHPALFAAIGVAYGIGDGVSTFAVPNLKGRAVVGLDAGQTEFNALNEVGGEKAHTLSANEMPAHSHTWSTPEKNLAGFLDGGSTDPVQQSGGKMWGWLGARTMNTGGGSAHNNLQPYIVLNYIIKT